MEKKMKRRKRKKAKQKYTVGEDGPRPVDVYVGSRVRDRRTLAGMSQQDLGDRLGLTFQQIQKYEKGTNRVSASKLWEIAAIVGVPVEWFFEGAEKPNVKTEEWRRKRKTIELVRAFNACPEETQKLLLSLFDSIARKKGKV